MTPTQSPGYSRGKTRVPEIRAQLRSPSHVRLSRELVRNRRQIEWRWPLPAGSSPTVPQHDGDVAIAWRRHGCCFEEHEPVTRPERTTNKVTCISACRTAIPQQRPLHSPMNRSNSENPHRPTTNPAAPGLYHTRSTPLRDFDANHDCCNTPESSQEMPPFFRGTTTFCYGSMKASDQTYRSTMQGGLGSESLEPLKPRGGRVRRILDATRR